MDVITLRKLQLMLGEILSTRIEHNQPFNRSSRLSRNLFFGSIPETAFLSTSAPPHLANMRSIVISFKEPGLVLCR